ncbi:hypothetical protein [Vulcanisaeta distributa]|uniref:hypothetical protein n=1 Tax=Vulcanisaeta distributa TaxID=164451 RepID=UPI0006D15ECE|nr:hypothetical protein [Vulcanisaeta distributa]
MKRTIKQCKEKFLDCAFDVIVKAKLGLIDKDEAFDALWEYLVNVEYEVKILERRISMSDNVGGKEANSG